MTESKARKAAIRARMAETGEPYTEAARQLDNQTASEVTGQYGCDQRKRGTQHRQTRRSGHPRRDSGDAHHEGATETATTGHGEKPRDWGNTEGEASMTRREDRDEDDEPVGPPLAALDHTHPVGAGRTRADAPQRDSGKRYDLEDVAAEFGVDLDEE